MPLAFPDGQVRASPRRSLKSGRSLNWAALGSPEMGHCCCPAVRMGCEGLLLPCFPIMVSTVAAAQIRRESGLRPTFGGANP